DILELEIFVGLWLRV
ncbi:phosphoglucosamine mutase, partial [Chlamydia psittaci 06-1683]